MTTTDTSEIEISVGGETWVYSFDRLSIAQVLAAQSIFQLQQERLTATKSVRDHKLSGNTTIIIDALGYLLTERKGTEGSYEYLPFNHERTPDRIKEFLNQPATAGQWGKVVKVRDDFFTRAGLLNAESLKQLAPLFDLMAKPELLNLMQMKNGANTLNDSADGNNSLIEPSLPEGSQ